MDVTTFSKEYRKKGKEIESLIKETQLFLKGSEADAARESLAKRVPLDLQEEWKIGFFPSNHLLFNSPIFDLGYWYWKKVQNDDLVVEVPVSILQHHPLTFPYMDPWGIPVGLMGRTLYDKDQQSMLKINKYKYTKDLDKSHYLYGLDRAKYHILKKRFAILVEGQIDTITCHSRGLTNTVGMGGSSFSPHQFRQLRMWTNRIVLVLDGDDAGRIATAKITEQYCEDAEILRIQLSDGQDVDDVLKGGSGPQLIEEINRKGGV